MKQEQIQSHSLVAGHTTHIQIPMHEGVWCCLDNSSEVRDLRDEQN